MTAAVTTAAQADIDAKLAAAAADLLNSAEAPTRGRGGRAHITVSAAAFDKVQLLVLAREALVGAAQRAQAAEADAE